MKITLFLIIAAISCTASFALCAGFMEKDASGNESIQGFAPNGKTSQELTVYRTAVDMRQKLAWQVYAGAACKFRIQSTATRAGMTHTLANGARSQVYYVNKATPFLNFTGCASSELAVQ